MATIYKILSPCLKECYVGSTICKIESRWATHRCEYNSTCSKRLFEKHGIENCKFVVLEVCSLEEQLDKEQWWMDHSVGLVNDRGAILNKEKQKSNYKSWREENKERIKETNKLYHEANREKRIEYSKQYYKANKEKFYQYNKLSREAKKDSPSAE